MSTKNIGQVSGVHIGSTPPANIIMIWYDNTPSQMVHKVYDVNLSQWVVLDKNTISTITYSELVNLATSVGLSVGAWFKISDRSNALALAVTTTKVQYSDSLGNVLIDDLGTNIQYHVTSSNLSIDDVVGVFDNVNKKLVFQFNKQVPDYTADDFILGKVKRNNVWSLAKYKLSSFLSKVTGNSISWNGGFFFNFNNAISNILDRTGGVVSKNTYDEDMENVSTAINNVGQENQTIIQNANQAIENATLPTAIYEKALPSNLEVGGAATNISKGDTLYTLISKIQRWINQFKLATGVRISPSFTQATSKQFINSNDSVESALGKVQYWFKNLKLSAAFEPYNHTGTIPDLAPEDSLEEAFRKVQGKLNQIGNLSDGKIESKYLVSYSVVPTATIDLKGGKASFFDPSNVYRRCIIDATAGSIEARDHSGTSQIRTSIRSTGVFSNGAAEQIYPGSAGISHGVSIAGLGYGNVPNDLSNTAFLAGVAGLASNSNPDPAPSYGGYFDKLKINGMYVQIRQKNSTYNMLSTDVFVSCYNSGYMSIVLPVAPYNGQTVYINQVNANGITISAGSATIIRIGGNQGSSYSTNNPDDRGKTFRLVWDGRFWIMNILS